MSKDSKKLVKDLFKSVDLQKGYDDIDWKDLLEELIPEFAEKIDLLFEQRIKNAKKSVFEWLDEDHTWQEDLDGLSGTDLAEAAVRHFIDELKK